MPGGGSGPRSRFPAAALVTALTGVGLALRAAGLDESLFGDELFTHEVATRPGFADMVDGVAGDLEISPPLYFAAAWVVAKLGDPQLWLRVPAFLAGAASVPVVYLLGVRSVGRTAALAGAALLAVAPFAIFYSTEARAYSLMALLVLLSTLALLVALERGGWLRWSLFALAAWAALFTHYTAIFALAAQAGWALWAHRDRLRELALAHGAIAIGLLPWLPAFLADRNSGFQTAIENISPLTISFFIRSLGVGFAGSPYLKLSEVPGEAALVLIGAGLLLALAGALGRSGAAERLREPRVVLVLALALVPPVAAALYSMVFASVFVPRTLLASLPAFCLALGLLLTAPSRRVAVAASALVLAGLCLGTAEIVLNPAKPPYREAARFVDERTAVGDPVLQVGLLDYGSLDVQLERPFRLYKQGCSEPVTGPGQILKGEVRCGGGEQGFERALREADHRLVLVTYGSAGALPVPGLADRFRLRDRRVFEHGLFPLEVREYAPG